jgi:fermentation-respiration switch protein FrsA (DUF1100 family)
MANALPLLLAMGLLALLWLGQRSLLYLPSGAILRPESLGLASAEEVTIRTNDGLDLGAWFVPSLTGLAKTTVIVFNGNAGNRSYRAPLAAGLSRRGFNVLLFDYRGYGGNPGSPSEQGLSLDAEAAWVYVTKRRSQEGNRVVYFGESLGTAVAVSLATTHPPAALVLRSPFTSMTDVASHHYWFLPVRRLLWDRYDSLACLRRVRCPLLVIAGTGDRVIPFGLSRRLYDAASGPKSFLAVPGADHNNADLVSGSTVVDAVTRLIDTAIALTPSR